MNNHRESGLPGSQGDGMAADVRNIIARRYYKGAAILVIGAVFYGCIGGQMDQNEIESIIAETQAFAEAMNAGDAALAASFYTEDGVRVGGFGDMQRGRAEIEAAYIRLLTETMPGAQINQERGTIRMLTPEFAVWQGGIEIFVSGSEEPIKGHVVQVMQKTGERWLILEAHPKLFPPRPAQ